MDPNDLQDYFLQIKEFIDDFHQLNTYFYLQYTLHPSANQKDGKKLHSHLDKNQFQEPSDLLFTSQLKSQL